MYIANYGRGFLDDFKILNLVVGWLFLFDKAKFPKIWKYIWAASTTTTNPSETTVVVKRSLMHVQTTERKLQNLLKDRWDPLNKSNL
jgi:hypothetical protein